MSSDVFFTPSSGLGLRLASAPAKAARLLHTIAGLPERIRNWRERMYVRRELMRLVKDGPELIDDIGLTMRQVEAEIAKPFWQV
jgi:uncharacterized protein YjiS (DUF1127 family)